MSLWDKVLDAGTVAGGIGFANLISDRGQQYAEQMGQLAGTLQEDSKFKGYGVKTGLANSTIGADGSLDLGVGQNQQLAGGAGSYQQGMNEMSGAAGSLGGLGTQAMDAYGQFTAGAMQDPRMREQAIYNRAMAMQQPMLDQQRAAGNAQEYAMGRGGVAGAQFGGSGEDAAMARAQAQAQNQASFQAMGQAQQEMMNQGVLANQFGQQAMGAYGQQGQLGQGMGGLGVQAYGQSFMPMQNQLQALQAGQAGGQMAQTGQLTGAGYGAQLGLGGIQTAVNADKTASELYGNLFGAMAGSESGDGGLFDRIRDWF